MGFFRIEMGSNLLGIEKKVAWATPGTFTEANFHPCFEDGSNCGPKTMKYVDPGSFGNSHPMSPASMRRWPQAIVW
jgi:hypothetical protein